jgi:hypothetical protein
MLKLTTSFLAALLVTACSGVGAGLRPLAEVVGQVTYSTCREGADRSTATGIRVEARIRQRGGLFQRFRWRVGEPVGETVTDSFGHFKLIVPPGTYYVLAHNYTSSWPPGYTPGWRHAPGLSDNDRVGAVETLTVRRGVPMEQDLWLLVVCER